MISLVLNIYRLLISVHGAITHRFLSLFFVCMLSACSTLPPYSGKIAISTTSLSQPVTGASCEVRTDAGKWTIITPAIAPVGQIAGDLHVVCQLQGYRTSEVIFRSGAQGRSASRVAVGAAGGSGGGGGGMGLSIGFGLPIGDSQFTYPNEIVVDMTPATK
jgi:uncharacterized membrane protein YgcG